jgi:hypothetical protein
MSLYLCASVYLPTIRAQLALNRNNPVSAIEVLEIATPYEIWLNLLPAVERAVLQQLGRH